MRLRVGVIAGCLAALISILVWSERGDPNEPGVVTLRERTKLGSGEAAAEATEVLRKQVPVGVSSSPAQQVLVVDGRRRPIANAFVELVVGSPAGSRVHLRVLTGMDGVATLEHEAMLGLPGRVTLLAHADGFRSRRLDQFAFDGAERVVVELDGGRSIRGLVLDDLGRPLPGVAVRASNAPALIGRSEAFSSASLLDDEKTRLDSDGESHSRRDAISDAAGEFVIDGLAEGRHALVVLDPRWIADPPVSVDAGTVDVMLRCSSQTRIELIPRDAEDGRLIEAFVGEVHLSGTRGGRAVRRSLFARSAGAAWFIGIAPREWSPDFEARVAALAPGYERAETVVAGSIGKTVEVDLRLERKPTRRVEVRLRTAEGLPLLTQALFRWTADDSPQASELSLYPDPDGGYQIDLPAGTWNVQALPDGLVMPEYAARFRVEVDTQSIAAELPRSGSVAIYTPEIRCGEGWSLILSGPRYGVVRPHLHRELVLTGLDPGTWRIVLRGPMGVAMSRELQVAESGVGLVDFW